MGNRTMAISEEIILKDSVTAAASAMYSALQNAASAARNTQAAQDALANAADAAGKKAAQAALESAKAQESAAQSGVRAAKADYAASSAAASSAAATVKAEASAKAAAERAASAAAKAAAKDTANEQKAAAKAASAAAKAAAKERIAVEKQAASESEAAAKRTAAAWKKYNATMTGSAANVSRFGNAAKEGLNEVTQSLGPAGQILRELGPAAIAAGVGIGALVVGFKAVSAAAAGLFNIAKAKSPALQRALNRLEGGLDRLLTSAVKQAGPAFDRAGEAIARLIGTIENSPALMNALVASFTALAGAIETIANVASACATALDSLLSSLAKFPEMLQAGGLSADDTKDTLKRLEDQANNTSAAFGALPGPTGSAASAIAAGASTIAGALGSWTSAGADLVAGFVAGIQGSVASALAAASSLGSGAAAALKSALGIGSPSKVAAGFGENVGVSFGDAMNDALPDVPAAFADASGANDVTPAVAAPSGGSTVYVTINVTQSNASAGDIEFAVRRGVEQALRQAS